MTTCKKERLSKDSMSSTYSFVFFTYFFIVSTFLFIFLKYFFVFSTYFYLFPYIGVKQLGIFQSPTAYVGEMGKGVYSQIFNT